jgi:hypothetical protein
VRHTITVPLDGPQWVGGLHPDDRPDIPFFEVGQQLDVRDGDTLYLARVISWDLPSRTLVVEELGGVP